MDPILGGLLSGGIGAISSMMNTSENNGNNQAMQLQAQQYNTEMSNTAYQRASRDMTAAGLNPAMMFGSGSAASSPTIQPAQRTSAAGSVGAALSSIVPSAVALKTANATIDNLVDQNAKIKAETLTEGTRPELVRADTQLRGMQSEKTDAEVRTLNEERKNIVARLPLILDEGTSARNRMSINPTVRSVADKAAFLGDRTGSAISPITNLVSSARGVSSIIRDHSDRY